MAEVEVILTCIYANKIHCLAKKKLTMWISKYLGAFNLIITGVISRFL